MILAGNVRPPRRDRRGGRWVSGSRPGPGGPSTPGRPGGRRGPPWRTLFRTGAGVVRDADVRTGGSAPRDGSRGAEEGTGRWPVGAREIGTRGFAAAGTDRSDPAAAAEDEGLPHRSTLPQHATARPRPFGRGRAVV